MTAGNHPDPKALLRRVLVPLQPLAVRMAVMQQAMVVLEGREKPVGGATASAERRCQQALGYIRPLRLYFQDSVIAVQGGTMVPV